MPKWDVCIKNETHNLKERIGQHLHLNQVPMLLFFLKPHDSVFFTGAIVRTARLRLEIVCSPTMFIFYIYSYLFIETSRSCFARP
jgi:hypothetical protein